ncbi:hypothetical protein QBZ16_004262 [Prototheca wickerhamii]|uniref:Protein kinase domain-containing protein n=1 Tax=Prototheca wickerhamii TaxID=3111 RepID=A0AAD9MHV7_PROWI|nr:hypothetical protein QBZ16_004262 [Prototheca wickerhamii]
MVLLDLAQRGSGKGATEALPQAPGGELDAQPPPIPDCEGVDDEDVRELVDDSTITDYESFMLRQHDKLQFRRTAGLQALQVNWSERQPRFDRVTSLVRSTFGVEVCMVSIIDRDMAHFLSGPRSWGDGAPARATICQCLADCSDPSMLIVEDVRRDPRFRENPFVQGPPYVSFYAGAPLISSFDGTSYGSLCVVDVEPRHFPPAMYSVLAHFAEILTRELERDRMRAAQEAALRAQAALSRSFVRGLDGVHERLIALDPADPAWPVVYANAAAAELLGLAPDAAAPPNASLWDLVQLEEGGDAARARVEAAVAARRPVTLRVLCRRRPAASTGVVSLTLKPSSDADLHPNSVTLGIPVVDEVDDDDNGEGGKGDKGGALDGNGGAHVNGARPDCHVALAAENSDQSSSPPLAITQNNSLLASDASFANNLAEALDPAAATGALARRARDAMARARHEDPLWFGVIETQDAAASAAEAAPGQVERGAPGGASARAVDLFAMRPQVMEEVTLGCLIGVGSSGRTYRGLWHGARVAVKIVECWSAVGVSELDRALARQKSVEERAYLDTHSALVEAALGRALAHPHVVPTFAYASWQGEPDDRGVAHCATWIVQAFCSRGSLVEARACAGLGPGAPNLRVVLATAGEIAGALCYLHSCGVVHGDLSGNNVLLNAQPSDPRRWVACVADFGLSQIKGLPMQHALPHGTAAYMPPERLAGAALAPAADAWSFGVLLWEMCAGVRAWDNLSYHQVVQGVLHSRHTLPLDDDHVPGVNTGIKDLIRDCLAFDPDARPTMAQISTRIAKLINELRDVQPVRMPAARQAARKAA